ncbi:hypothetical protein LUZ63_009786 [Rhynchospora breviuscula]|uniref:F-box domain-containing protein n=1 Tax=Rhynchospora breviuscula TaxID=2022672 RepID=A0A9Q0HPD0_9POAL|nr:hypothetical protein LUZ63_009786 [Rhynchospora breviuscula]
MSGTDRISQLPDAVLTQILSYRPTKEAVRTCLLSKRWKNVWASVPVLDFDFADFLTDDIFILEENKIDTTSFGRFATYSERPKCHDNFVIFIDTALALRLAQLIDRFKLVWQYQIKPYHCHDHPVRRWILRVLQQSPRVLSIYVQPTASTVDVPDLVFTCSSLEEMKLQVDNKTKLEVLNPVSVNLPHLRKLNLGYFKIEADCMNILLRGCPNLEELELYACELNLSQISCGYLKSLVIAGCYYCSGEIRVSIPSLQYLEVAMVSSQPAGFAFENMSSLVKACVCFLTVDDLDPKFSDSETMILNGLLGVKNLEVVLYGSHAKDMLEHALKNCPFFENLKAAHFESFKGYLYGCIGIIDHLVQHAPILEDLTFYCCEDKSNEIELSRLRQVSCDGKSCRWVESKQGHIYGSADELEGMSINYVNLIHKIPWEVVQEDDDVGGEALLEEEAGEDGEADLGEEAEQDDVQQ